MSTASQTLRAAAEHIETVGWSRGNYFDPLPGQSIGDASCCILGAIRYVSGRFVPREDIPSTFTQTEDAAALQTSVDAESTLAALLGQPGSWRIPAWNDAGHRTEASVLNALREAAALAEQREMAVTR